MVRPRRIRRIFFQPDVTYFKPAGIPLSNLREAIINFDELEAIRLVDSKGMEQNKAGKKMKISQSTLSRLLKTGRKKLADAITTGQAIKIQGGNFKMARENKTEQLGFGPRNGRGRMGGFAAGPGGICKCTQCNYEEPQIRGQPCNQKKCPKCGALMTRK